MEVLLLMNLNASIINLPQKILKANVLLVCEGKHLCKIMALPLITICVITCACRSVQNRFPLKSEGSFPRPLSNRT